MSGRNVDGATSLATAYTRRRRAVAEGTAVHQTGDLPTGFPALDDALGGGLHPRELLVLGGTPGVGKTIAALQWARTLAKAGVTVVYACYEHGEEELLDRVLAAELAETAGRPVALQLLHAAMREHAPAPDGSEPAGASLLLRSLRERLDSYSHRLLLLRASGRSTGLAELEAMLQPHSDGPCVLVVDYLHKVAMSERVPDDGDRSILLAQELKELALRSGAAVIAIAAATELGLQERRIRGRHLRGAAALVYEADIVVLMNEKSRALSKVHLAYDNLGGSEHAERVIFSIEKNRRGPAGIDLDLRKDFAGFRFHPDGHHVLERLIDDLVLAE